MLFLQLRAQRVCYMCVEIIIFIVNPLFDDTSCDFIVIVIKREEFACLLIDAYVDVSDRCFLTVFRKLLTDFSDGSLYLLDGLFCSFHGFSLLILLILMEDIL